MYQETKELPVTAPAKVGQYHDLAEAIRRGCQVSKPRHGEASHIYRDGTYATCVLGACALGLGELDESSIASRYFWLKEHFPILIEAEARFEGLGSCRREEQTREQIADWLDTL
jgi:uncharacterized protein (DUF169 family)